MKIHDESKYYKTKMRWKLCDLQKIQNVIIFQCQSPFQAELFSKYNDMFAEQTTNKKKSKQLIKYY